MTFNEYQEASRKTAIYPSKNDIRGLLYVALGLGGEAGEVCNKVKKILRDDLGVVAHLRRLEIMDELGDVLWYAAAVASELNVTLEFIAEKNLTKLAKRATEKKLHGSGDSR